MTYPNASAAALPRGYGWDMGFRFARMGEQAQSFLLALALGPSNIVGVPYYPLGRTVIAGLATATVLTLLVAPLCYTLFDDLRGYFARGSRGGKT